MKNNINVTSYKKLHLNKNGSTVIHKYVHYEMF
jgi:hypothetical protein